MSHASTFLAALTDSLPQGLRDLVDKVGLPVVGLAGLAVLLGFFLFGRRLVRRLRVSLSLSRQLKLGVEAPTLG